MPEIKIICGTNLDKFQREFWPDKLPAMPQVGNFVLSESGDAKLRIVELTWRFDGVLLVELHY